MPTLAVGMTNTRENRHMPTVSVGMAPDLRTFRGTENLKMQMLKVRCAVMLAGTGLIALTLAGCGGASDSGPQTASFQEQIAAVQKETDPELRARQLIKIGERQGEAKDRAGAEQTLRLAKKDCESVAAAADQAGAYVLLAEALARLDNRSAARRAIQAAAAAAGRIEDLESKAKTLARLAEVQAYDDLPAAAATLQAAEQAALKTDDPQGKILSLCAVAVAYGAIDRKDQHERVLGAALEFAKSLGDPQKRCAALGEVAANQSDLDGPDAAAKTFDLALEAAGQIADPYAKSYAMGELSKKFSAAGMHAKAHELLGQAEHLAKKVPQPDMRAEALENIRTLQRKLPKPP